MNELMRHWLWMQTMEYALQTVKDRGKGILYPMSKYDEWKHIGWRTIQRDIFNYVLDNWETPTFSGSYSGHSHYDIGKDLTANGTGVTGEYKDMVVIIKWPEVQRFIKKMLTPEDKQLDLFELLAEEARR